VAKTISQNDLSNDDDDDNTIGPHQAKPDFLDEAVDDIADPVGRFLGFFIHRTLPCGLRETIRSSSASFRWGKAAQARLPAPPGMLSI
jgi:hypothetical protein